MALIDKNTYVITDLVGDDRKRITGVAPQRDENFEDIFYSTVSGNVRYRKWLDLIYSEKFATLVQSSRENTIRWLQEQLFLTREDVIELFAIESQRRLEMFYINRIVQEITKGNMDLRGIIPSNIFTGLLHKYPPLEEMIVTPTPTKRKYTKRIKMEVPHYDFDANITKQFNPEKIFVKENIQKKITPPVPKTMGKRGRPLGRGEFDEVERVRRDLIHCIPIPKISKTLGYSQQTLYNVIEKNAFTQPAGYKRDENTYLESAKGFIARHGGTWQEFIEKHTICERALYKKLMDTDPDFVEKYNIIPTPHSIMYELEVNVRSKIKVAEAFGVDVETVREWIQLYNLIKPISEQTRTERRGGIFTEEQERLYEELEKQRRTERESERGGRK